MLSYKLTTTENEVEQKSKSYIPFDAGWEGAKNFLSEKIDEAKVIEKELLQVKATLFVNFGPEQNRNAQIVTQSMTVEQMCFSVLNHYVTENQSQQQEIERLKELLKESLKYIKRIRGSQHRNTPTEDDLLIEKLNSLITPK